MPASRLRSVYKEFHLTINGAFEWIKAINDLASSSSKQLKKEHIYFAYELAFIKIFTGWEKFLQESFISYMTGSRVKGYKPKLYIKRVNRNHALKILSGTEDYPDWTKIEEVYTLAELFFTNGAPFKLSLQQIEKEYNDMKKTRNAIVHISSKAMEKFEGLLRARIPSYRTDMTPGEFLGYPLRKGSNETYLEYYVSFLKTSECYS
jgi:hypothetical protein